MDNATLTGQRIRALRKKRNIKIPIILEKMDKTRSALTGWEIGRRNPTKNDLIKLADILETSVDYLTGKTDNDTPADYNDIQTILSSTELTYKGQKITDEQAESLKRVLKALLDK